MEQAKLHLPPKTSQHSAQLPVMLNRYLKNNTTVKLYLGTQLRWSNFKATLADHSSFSNVIRCIEGQKMKNDNSKIVKKKHLGSRKQKYLPDKELLLFWRDCSGPLLLRSYWNLGCRWSLQINFETKLQHFQTTNTWHHEDQEIVREHLQKYYTSTNHG